MSQLFSGKDTTSIPPPTARISPLFLAVLIIIFIAVHRITDLVYGTGFPKNAVHGIASFVYGTGFLNGAVHGIASLVYGTGFLNGVVHRIASLVYGESKPARNQQAQSGQSSPWAELRRPL